MPPYRGETWPRNYTPPAALLKIALFIRSAFSVMHLIIISSSFYFAARRGGPYFLAKRKYAKIRGGLESPLPFFRWVISPLCLKAKNILCTNLWLVQRIFLVITSLLSIQQKRIKASRYFCLFRRTKQVHKFLSIQIRFLPQHLSNRIMDDGNALSLPKTLAYIDRV